MRGSHMVTEEALDDFYRARIFNFIRENPDMTLGQIRKRLSAFYGRRARYENVQNHVSVLEKGGFIKSYVNRDGNRCYAYFHQPIGQFKA